MTSSSGGAGDDVLAGGPGNDRYVFDADDALGNDTVSEVAGEGSQDVLDFSATSTLGIRVDLALLVRQAITNGALSSLTLVLPFVENLIGGEKGDVLLGNDAVNRLEGRDGNDVLTGRGGDDVLVGGTGNGDRVEEEIPLNATLITNPADPTQSNLVWASVVVVPTDGSAEVDSLLGVETATLRGSTASNRLDAREFFGSVQLLGGDGDDTLRGGVFGDLLDGGKGNDVMQGGNGPDVYRFNADTDAGADRVEEDAHFIFAINTSIDTLDFSMTQTQSVRLDLGSTLIQSVAVGLTVQLRWETLVVSTVSVENLIGGQNNDTLTGNVLNNLIEGRGGNDRIVDGGVPTVATTDLFIGGEGDDTYSLNALSIHTVRILEDIDGGGVDTLDFSGLVTALFLDLSDGKPRRVESGNRLTLELIGCQGLENVIGTNQNDDIRGNSADNRLEGRGGNDFLSGDRGNDVLIGGIGNERMFGGRGDDRYVYTGSLSLGTDQVIEVLEEGVDTVDLSGFVTGGAILNLALASVSQNVGSGTRISLNRSNTLETALYPPTGPPPSLASADEWRLDDLALNTRLVPGRSSPGLAQTTLFASSFVRSVSKPALAQSSQRLIPTRSISLNLILHLSTSIEDEDPFQWFRSTDSQKDGPI